MRTSDPGCTPTFDVSIIIPIGPGETTWRALLNDLRDFPFSAEVLCIGTSEQPEHFPAGDQLGSLTKCVRVVWIVAQRGRARQMNCGAEQAGGRFLWFLHADSRLDQKAFEALKSALDAAPGALHYFNLRFQTDGPRWMRLNAWGVWFRSHLLGMPFGDQGFCISRDLFWQLGGYSETAKYGEDHLLAWLARRRGIPLRCTQTVLQTSARTYRERGWLRTTCRHIWLTYRQAWPQFWLWMFGR